MSDRAVRLTMIGAGGHATRNILPCLSLLNGVEVVANADLDQEKARRAAMSFGIPRFYGNYRRMLDEEKSDGVIICVGADFHGRAAVELMEAGFHVYVEKPPAVDLAQARRMEQASRRSGRICMTAFKKRFAPAYQKARNVITGGDFGAPTLLTITRTSGHWREGDDSVSLYLRENSIHVLDLAVYLFGPVRRIFVVSRAPATAVISMEFENGAVGNVSVTDRMSYKRGWEVVTIVGDGGVCVQVDNSVEMIAYQLDQPIAAHKPEFVAGSSHSAVEQGFSGELQAFADAIRAGTRPEADIASTVHVMAILSAIGHSLKLGQPVSVEESS